MATPPPGFDGMCLVVREAKQRICGRRRQFHVSKELSMRVLSEGSCVVFIGLDTLTQQG